VVPQKTLVYFTDFTKDSNIDPAEVSQKGGFFYCPDEVIDHKDRGQIMLECEQLMLKVTAQRRSAIRTGPAGSDNGHYVAHGLALLNEIRTWCVVRQGGVPGTGIIGTYGGLDVWYIDSYFTGAVRNENTSCKGVGASLLDSVGFSVFMEGFLVFDLLRLLIPEFDSA
jgi:hypothetical protein